MRRRATRRRLRPRRLWPEVNHYRALMPGDEERQHPIDVHIEASPGVRRAFRRVRALERRLRVVPGTERALREYVDARTALQTAREEAAINSGVEVGRVIARAEVLGRTRRAHPAFARFHRELRGLILSAEISTELRLAALLECAYALVAGPGELEVPSMGPSEAAKRGGRARRKQR